jgi:hypothetical protein
VQEIISINHAWKRQRDILSANNPIALMLQSQKSLMQVGLLRDFPGEAYLRLDTENVDGEALYSVRLKPPIRLSNGRFKEDAEHLPVRLAKELLTEDELLKKVGQ